MYEYNTKIIEVVDGDTVHATVDYGFDEFSNKTLRLAGINAPELPTPEGIAAKERLIELIAQTGGAVVITTKKDRKEKYGRYLATLWPRLGASLSLNQIMIDEGFAVVYNG